MLRARHAMLTLLPAILVGYAACGAEDSSEDDTTENIVAAEAQVGTAPTAMIGTFRSEGSHAGIAVLTLKKDWTFHLEEGIECIRAPCIRPEMNGFYKLATLDGSPVLMLIDEEQPTAGEPEYLRYISRGDVLYVAPFARYATWQALRLSDQAWCGVPNDCPLQNLQEGPCANGWHCAANVCRYSCGPVSCEMDNTCPTM